MKKTLLAVFTLSLLAAGARAEVDKKVERTYKAKCASCHGASGEKLAFKKANEAKFKAAIENGAKNDKDTMEGYKDKLDAATIDGLTAYAQSLAK